LLQTEVRFLQPDMAVVHWSWKIEGDRNFDGTPRQQRFGLMTMVAQKRSGAWQVVVAQNTNAMPGTPPEIQDIKTPIAVPNTAAKP
jgi:ketosteroid isomerase-like protein